MPTTYATNVPFPVNEGHTFVKLLAPSPYFPSHYIPPKSGRYFPNLDGVVYCPEEYVPVLLSESCKLAEGVTLAAHEGLYPEKTPATKALPDYQPLAQGAPTPAK